MCDKQDGDAIAVTNGYILVTYHRVSTRLEEEEEKEKDFVHIV